MSVFPKSISLEETNVSISPGESLLLKATLTPDNVTVTELKWESSDMSIVSVDEKGLITGIKDGKAKVTATTINGINAVCNVVVQSLPESIILNVSESLELNIGEPFQLKATVLPEGCKDNEVSWFSDNEEVVSVEDGHLFTHQHGVAYVTAKTDNEISAQCKIEVANEKFEVEILPDTIDVYYGQERKIEVEVHAKQITKHDIQLNIESPKYASLLNDSTIIGLELGSTILTASYAGEVVAKNVVNVIAIKLYIDELPHYILPYDDFYLDKIKVSIVPEELESKFKIEWAASTIPGVSMYSSSDNTIMCWQPTTVSFKACVYYGDYIFYSNKGTLVCTNLLITTPDSVVTKCGQTEVLEASIKASSSSNTQNANTKWETSDDSIVEIIESDLYKCRFKSLKTGVATITASVNGGAYSSTLIIVEEPILISAIQLSEEYISLNYKEEFQLTATIDPEDATFPSLLWTSSDESIASVSDDGLVTATGFGEAVITAKANDGSDVYASCMVKVSRVLVNSISLDRKDWIGKVGEKMQLEASILPEDATNKTIVWTSSNESVATVSDDGLVNALKVGETVIKATTIDGSDLTVSCDVTVIPVLVESISISPESWDGEEGESFQLNVTVLPENATNKSLLYLSTDKSIAEVDQEGLVSVLSEGNCKIIVSTLDGTNLTAECIITSTAGIQQKLSSTN